MALLQINADLRRLCAAAERIALALEWHLALLVDPNAKVELLRTWKQPSDVSPCIRIRPRGRRIQPIVSAPSDEELWEAEQEQLRRRLAGLPEQEEETGASAIPPEPKSGEPPSA